MPLGGYICLFAPLICHLQEGLDTSSENGIFMADSESIDQAISEYVEMLDFASVEDVLQVVMSEHPSLEHGEVRKALLSLKQPAVTQIKPPTPPSKPKIEMSRYREGHTRKQYNKLAQTLGSIVKIVDESPDGISKTGILRKARRVNSYWKPIYGRLLEDLLDMGVIQRDNNTHKPSYYPHDAYVHNREREVHRRIVEALQIHGQMTMTQLAIKIGRNGGSNRNQVSLAIDDLRREGFIRLGERSRWAWIA